MIHQENSGARLVAYYRVSTDRQGKSGLGLEAQERAVADYAARTGGQIVAGYTEVESGTVKHRPELIKAQAHAKRCGACLVVAKLDRLSRNMAFVAALMDSGCEFVACDNPHANRLTLHILAAVAEDEALRISARTKAALAARKARGLPLGNPANLRRGNSPAIEQNRAKANDFAAKMRPIVADLQAGGVTGAKDLAAALNQRGYTAANGGQWHPTTAARLLARL